MLGLAFLLLGAAAVVSRLIPKLAWRAPSGRGLLSLGVGISVGYPGLESGFQDALGIAFQLVVLAFVVGRRAREPDTRPAST